uniref:NADH-ubiquinone oxidoreductase chain 5 n=1 Tax=Aurospio banyulensis TaxID=3050091 RepID=A0AAU6QGQ1_9ANNE
MLSRSYPLLSAFFLYSLSLMVFPCALFLMLKDKTIIMDWLISSFASPILFTLIIDPHGMILSAVVLFISANVMVFAHSYMSGDPFMARFIILVLLFVASMNFLIYIPNLMTLLIGWDGLGLVSFLLVIYYQNPKSLAAGMITALTNRVGDVLILISIAWTINLGQWNFIFFSWSNFSIYLSGALMIAAMTKSAQIPFSSWLPAAMAAPTPVSALVHSSTLVTAGVFILFRFYPSLSFSPLFNKSLLIMATLTCLMAGLSANTECDMKKIIALSTLSQLGVMMVSIGLGAPLLAFFHLITHALFKALLFLCAGTLIHLHMHSQDLRFMGNLNLQMPSITSAMMVSNLALCGTPFLAGFYSKDAILELCLFSPYSLIIIFLFFFATGLTVSYTMRFLITVVWGPINLSSLHPVNDTDFFCTLPTFTLSAFSIIGGASLNWILITPFSEPILPPPLKFMTLSVCFLGGFFGYKFSSLKSGGQSSLLNAPELNYASCMMWFLAPLSTQKMLAPSYWIAHQLSKTLDQGWEELCGGQGTMLLSSKLSTTSLTSSMGVTTTHVSLAAFTTPLLMGLLFI